MPRRTYQESLRDKDDDTPIKPKKTQIQWKGTPIRIRSGPGINFMHKGEYLKDGVYEIDEMREGKGSKSGWGHLANGVGWVALDFVEILK